MYQAYIDISFYSMLYACLGVIIILTPLIVVQTYIFKKHLDKRYFNDKHFNQYELNIFNSFPLSYLKTLAYIRAIVFPRTLLKRFSVNIANINENPIIYSLALLTIILLTICSVIFLNFFIFFGIDYLLT